jgi:FSR family fosmidomycin resistance protein-like MFS transporter
MSTSTPSATASALTDQTIQKTVFSILLAISFSHLLNDTMQSLITASYPILKTSLRLDFGQLGLISFCFQLTASLLQPFVGLYTDKRPQPYSLAAGMCFTLAGLIILSRAASFPLVLVAVALVGNPQTTRGPRPDHPAGADLLQILLHGLDEQLLYLFRDG